MQNVSKTKKKSRKGKTFFPFNTTQNEKKKKNLNVSFQHFRKEKEIKQCQ